MKAWITSLIISLLAASGAQAQSNRIGMSVNENPPHMPCYAGSMPGQFMAYIFFDFPVDGDGQPFSTLGGFQFEIILPVGFLTGNVTLPEGVVNNATEPVFDCAGTVTVTDDHAILATLSIGTFTETEGLIYLGPIPDPAIPGSMVVYDAADMVTPIVAVPISGEHADPVFGIAYYNCTVPDGSSRSWSTLKALYR